ncbi:flavodoxin [Clostridium saccharoperbutylacetonicum]|uniref:Flavodoxin n=1 Tax=Clostridium saccharoperbutylacetonicum N1-4(HMT) TaxID=931276 RepID=M1MBJ8_9CLOT|nr:flavodoxin domain-containing protein [Clostridium saccharoperbutylacetonicum]AGF55294.1 flavodoxin [Clostridium saccharoperbutylacetonicum N1-4(HMT)]NRT63993.1 flavodoxin [Clostridium saccharoperbutylacetonicum]NSB27360.1 flavodoxin [Clostridium saccharoperbutylacetonicum]NSB40849.1 flavodoxin [Clostridium saccharoperbutylacetonicum]
MRNTLIISESHYGTAKRAADIIALILGNSRSVDVSKVPLEINKYKNIVLVFGFYGYNTGKKLKEYLVLEKNNMVTKNVAIIGVGLSCKDITKYAESIENCIGKKAEFVDFVQGELRIDKLTEEDKIILMDFFKKTNMKFEDMGNFDKKKAIELASRLARILNKPEQEMEREELINEINKFITSHNTCTLSTGSGNFIRNTPIEHIYYKNNFYFISEGGFKFKGLLQNSNVCIAIFNNYTSMSNLKGLQVSGKGMLIPYLSEEYIEGMSFKGIKMETLNNIPINMNLIKVVPEQFEFLNTDFKNKGFDSKQYYFA